VSHRLALDLIAATLAAALSLPGLPASAASIELFPGARLDPTPNGTPAKAQLGQGIEALRRGDLQAAAASFTESARLDPKSPLPLVGQAEIALRRNRPAEAETWMQRALKLAPENAAVLAAAGRVAFATKQPSTAEARWTKAIAVDAELLSPRLDLGEFYLLTLRRPKDAAETYRAAVGIDPKNADAHLGLGLALAAIGDLVGGLAECETAAKLAPGSTLPRLATADLQLKLARPDQALATYEGLLKAKPDLLPALLGKGNAYLAKRDTANALTAYRAATAAAPKDATAQFRLGTLLQALQRPDEAETAYLAALAADPKLASAYNNLAWISAERGRRLDDALKWAQQAIKLNPAEPQYLDTLGWVYRARRDPDRALAALEKAAQMKPPLATILVHLGLVYEEKGRREDALAAYQQALKLNQPSPEVEFAKKQIQALSS
jgi:tetratricopeptide (TPR) repeat protein